MDKDTASARKQAQTALQDKISAKVNILDQLASVALSTYQRNYHAANTIMRSLGESPLISRLNAAYVREKFLSHEEAPGTFNERLTRFKALIRWGYEDAMTVQKWRYLAELTALPGLRCGETLALHVDDMDLRHRPSP